MIILLNVLCEPFVRFCPAVHFSKENYFISLPDRVGDKCLVARCLKLDSYLYKEDASTRNLLLEMSAA